MSIARFRTIVVASTILIGSCVQHQIAPEAPPESNPAIMFHNQGHDRIQVYLVGETEEQLLGRLEPLETARLVLPEWSFDETPGTVRLAVIAGWSKDLRPSLNSKATFSVKEFKRNLSGEEWTFVGGQLIGTLR